AQTDERSWHLLPPLHVRQEIRAAGDEHRVARNEQLRGFLHRARCVKREERKSHHDGVRSVKAFPPEPSAAVGALRDGVRSAKAFALLVPLSFVALPSPPSQGGGTSSGSGQAMSGKRAGP